MPISADPVCRRSGDEVKPATGSMPEVDGSILSATRRVGAELPHADDRSDQWLARRLGRSAAFVTLMRLSYASPCGARTAFVARRNSIGRTGSAGAPGPVRRDSRAPSD